MHELARQIASKRLKHRKLAVIDATSVRPADRKGWVELARQWHALPVAIVFDPGGGFMWVAAFGTDRVAAVDTNGNVLARIEAMKIAGTAPMAAGAAAGR